MLRLITWQQSSTAAQPFNVVSAGLAASPDPDEDLAYYMLAAAALHAAAGKHQVTQLVSRLMWQDLAADCCWAAHYEMRQWSTAVNAHLDVVGLSFPACCPSHRSKRIRQGTCSHTHAHTSSQHAHAAHTTLALYMCMGTSVMLPLLPGSAMP
jgi:hypothetical protein